MIIVTLFTLKDMLRSVNTKDQSNADCTIVYGILFVDTVDTKIKAHNALNAMFVETVDTTVKDTSTCIQCYLCRRC